jgi:DNA-binding IclR family transcriptional regulator
MLKPTPAVVRSTKLLDFLAARPYEAFTLSELAAAVEISPASALAILHALAGAGYVRRHPVQKTYVLGPALVVVGEAARARHRLLDAATAEIELIAAETHAECSVGVAAGHDMLIVAIAGRPAVDIADVRVGERVPFRPPWGAVQVAWESEETIAEWVARAAPSPDLEAQLHDALAAIRARGYSLGRESDARIQFGSAMRRLVDHPTERLDEEAAERLFAELARGLIVEPREGDPVNTVSAPVFDNSGQVAMQLSLQGFPTDLPLAQVHAFGERLRAGAVAIARQAAAAPVRRNGRTADPSRN